MAAGLAKAPFILGLSGASASGKTTVARLLRDILPIKVTILHQDDFFFEEANLPYRNGLVNWDCAASLDIKGMVEAIQHLKSNGQVPPGFVSKEDRNEIGPSGVSEETVQRLREEMKSWAEKEGIIEGGRELFIIDGFLLFGKSVKDDLGMCFDLKLLLRATYEKGKQRRENRPGYATIEGFWTDPPGYWDKIVWPEYIDEHAYMFKDGDVEGEPDQRVLEKTGVHVLPGDGSLGTQDILEWVLSNIKIFFSSH